MDCGPELRGAGTIRCGRMIDTLSVVLLHGHDNRLERIRLIGSGVRLPFQELF